MASRGALLWEDDPKHPAGRRLRRLTPIWVADERRGPTAEPGTARVSKEEILRGMGGFEILEDLLPQIEELGGGASADALAERARIAADRLIAVGRHEWSGAGLDVYVLAAVRIREQLGRIVRMLDPMMRVLAAKNELQSPRHDLLNFILILDVEQYWAETPAALAVRAALVDLVREKREAGRHGADRFGRVYLFDGGRASALYQPPDVRLEEAHLFADFLLSANQRHDERLRTLYQPGPLETSPFCAVGLRSVELDRQQLAWLSSACFAATWLPLLLREQPAAGETAIEATIEPFLPDSLARAPLPQAIESLPENAVREARGALRSFLPAEAQWARTVSEHIAARHATSMRRMEDLLDREVFRPLRDKLDAFATAFRQEVDVAIRSDHGSETLGGVIARLTRVITALEHADGETQLGEPPPPAIDELEVMHRRYLAFAQRQVRPDGLRRWWPAVALALGLLATPIAAEGLTELADTIAGTPVARWDDEVRWLSLHAWIPGVAIVLFTWAVLRRWGGAAVEARVERARRFFTDPERGRLADRLRRAIDRLLEQPLIRLVASARVRRRRQATRRVLQEVRRTRRLLEMRREEVRWLTGQLKAFLRLHGIVEQERGTYRFIDDTPRLTKPRIRLEAERDLKDVSVPVNEHDAGAYQHQWKIFDGWSAERSAGLLDPLAFLERLNVHMNVLRDTRRPHDDWERVKTVLTPDIVVSQGILWLSAEGLPAPERVAVVPDEWRQHLSDQLEDLGYRAGAAPSPSGRLFLLEFRTNVPEALMLGQRS